MVVFVLVSSASLSVAPGYPPDDVTVPLPRADDEADPFPLAEEVLPLVAAGSMGTEEAVPCQ